MVAKLTSPEELERHFCCTACIIYITCGCGPVAAFIKVITCIGVYKVLTQQDTILWKNVCVLYFMLVGDTTATLVKLVVPRNSTTGYKSFGNKAQVLFKGEVGEHTCDGLLFVT